MSLTTNKAVLTWVDEMAAIVQPDSVVWIDGSEEQLEELRAIGCSTGEMIKLNQELLPGCYYHRSAVNDVARVEDRTFICCKNKDGASDAHGNKYWCACENQQNHFKKCGGAQRPRKMYGIIRTWQRSRRQPPMQSCCTP